MTILVNNIAHVPVQNITLHYVCDKEDEHESGVSELATQPLADIVYAGTLICPECGDDMELQTHVVVSSQTTV